MAGFRKERPPPCWVTPWVSGLQPWAPALWLELSLFQLAAWGSCPSCAPTFPRPPLTWSKSPAPPCGFGVSGTSQSPSMEQTLPGGLSPVQGKAGEPGGSP